MSRLAVYALAAGVSLALAGCDIEDWGDMSRFKEDFSYSYPLKSGGKVSLESFNGSVEVIGWEKDSIQITGTKYAASEELLQAIKIDISAAPDAVRIRTFRPMERRGNLGAKYVLRVPARVELERIESSNGGVRIEGLTGPVRLKTSNGGVKIWKLKGPLEAATSNGGIEVTEFEGSAVLRSSNGGIRAEGVRGHFEATTSNASIDARLSSIESGRPVKLDTSNGPITVTLEEVKGNDIIADTSNSSITVKLPSAAGAQARASTSNGNIQTDFDVSVRGTQSKNRLEGAIGGGGPLLDLTTSNGNIRIHRL
ncbi:MAG: hypothetical protein SFV54_20700 [Bryobacteraceae bacterium]|nr:hypothetical protein [Bryobacteraceae bacterium]